MSSTIHAAVNPPSSNCTAATSVTSTTTSLPSTSTVPEHVSFKNRLQEFAQRANIPIPSYVTVSVNGPNELPRFMSSVDVDGETYTSLNAYSNKKGAEQDAAKVALEGIYKKIKDSVSKKTTINGFPPIFQDKVFCKFILHEFAVKMNLEMPRYETVKLEGQVPVFVTSLIFNGVKHVGTPGLNKKEAQQLAARTAILSILVDSKLGMQLSEVVKSKAKLLSIVNENIHTNECPSVPYVQPNEEMTFETSAIKQESQATSQTDCVTKKNKVGLEGGNQSSNVIKNTEPSKVEKQSYNIPSKEFRKLEVGTFSQAVPPPISNVVSGIVEPGIWTFSREVTLPVLYPSLEGENPSNVSPCGKKRKQGRKRLIRKLKKKVTQSHVSKVPQTKA